MNEVVITGLGAMCPLGLSPQAAWASVAAGRSGVSVRQDLADAGWVAPFGGIVTDFDPKQWVKPRKSLKVMAREIQLAFAAGEQAWSDAGLEDAGVDPERVGVVTGAGLMYCDMSELEGPYLACLDDGRFAYDRWGGAGLRALFPLWMLKYLPNMSACHIGIRRDARGPTNTIASEDASSLLALAEAAAIIRRGAADVMLTGGASSRMYMTDSLWRTTGAMWAAGEEPARMHRPFDARRNGCVCGEGAAVLVLESEAHARARGAKVWARVAGVASRAESALAGAGLTGDSIAGAISGALELSDTRPGDLAAVSAQGFSKPDEDRVEAQAIASTLGDTLVTAPKSFMGDLGAATGAVELAVGLVGLEQNFVAPTLNYREPDPECPVNVATELTKTAKRRLMSLSFNPAGQAVAAVIEA